MRDFSKISPAVWQSKRFNSLPSQDGRYLYLYLLSSQHQNSAGAYQLRDAYGCADLNWSLDSYQRARAELVAADLIAFDESDSVVMITRWFRHNPPMSESHLIGIERITERLPSDSIAEAVREAAQEAWRVQCDKKAAEAERKQKPAAPRPNGPSQHLVSTMAKKGW